jgi:hypothetical protein
MLALAPFLTWSGCEIMSKNYKILLSRKIHKAVQWILDFVPKFQKREKCVNLQGQNWIRIKMKQPSITYQSFSLSEKDQYIIIGWIIHD